MVSAAAVLLQGGGHIAGGAARPVGDAVLFAGLLQEDGLRLSRELRAVCRRLGSRQGEEPLTPAGLDGLRDLVRHFVRHGSAPPGIAEDMDLVEADPLQEGAGLLEFLLRLAGEAHDHIGRDGRPVIVAAQKVNAPGVLHRRVVAVHAAQGRVASALQGEMEVGADLVQGGELPDEALRHDPGLQRAHADPLQPPDGTEPAQERQEGFARPERVKPDRAVRTEIEAVGAHMDPGQHDLPDAACDQVSHLLQDILRLPAADAAARVGDDAVAAELVAAVLDLDVGPGVSRVRQPHGFILRRRGQVLPPGGLALRHGLRLLRCPLSGSSRAAGSALCPAGHSLLPPGQISCQDVPDLRLAVVADHQIDRFVPLHPVRVGLHIAAHGDDHRVRVLLFGPVQHLAALAVRNVGHRAGVDHIDIRPLVKGDFEIALVPQDLAHDIQFIAVDLAAQVVKSGLFHHFSHRLDFYLCKIIIVCIAIQLSRYFVCKLTFSGSAFTAPTSSGARNPARISRSSRLKTTANETGGPDSCENTYLERNLL